MTIDFKYSVGSKVFWNGTMCLIVGIYVYQNATYDYHVKIIGREKQGVYKLKESELEGWKRSD